MSKLTALFASIALLACASESSTETAAAEESIDSALTGQSEAAVIGALIEGTEAATATDAALLVAARANLSPASCATTTTSGTTTTVVLAGCTGTRGLLQVSGTIEVTITAVTASSVSFNATASDLQIDGATINLAVDATYRASNGTNSIDVSSSSSGVGPRGHAITHAGDYTASWDGNCASVDGSWATANEASRRSLEVSVERCLAACPTGSVTRTRLDNSTLEVTFDGSNLARFESSRRGSGTIALACTP